MSIQLSDVQVGSVVLGMDGKIAVVVKVDVSRPRRPLSVKMKAGGPVYVAHLDDFASVVGQVDMVKFEAPMGLYNYNLTPSNFADVVVEPPKANDLKAGDKIQYKHGGRVVVVEFNGYNWGRPKYPVLYTLNGKRWKGTVEGIVGKVADANQVDQDGQSEADGLAEAAAS